MTIGFLNPNDDPISTPPDIQGSCGRAWLCDLTAGQKRAGIKPSEDAAIVRWLIEAPSYHLFWHSYSILLMHLRPMEGIHTRLYLPPDKAKYEMHLDALSATAKRQPMVDYCDFRRACLQPGNFAAQFFALSDEGAKTRIRESVQEICAGHLSPDTDFTRLWIERYGDNMVKVEYRSPI